MAWGFHHAKVTRARWIGGVAGLVTALFLMFAPPHFNNARAAIVIAADIGLIACVLALLSYFAGRWSKT
jgi:drug/metabolite transporter (DMT)-like permease